MLKPKSTRYFKNRHFAKRAQEILRLVLLALIILEHVMHLLKRSAGPPNLKLDGCGSRSGRRFFVEEFLRARSFKPDAFGK